jgi:hypothetical protein
MRWRQPERSGGLVAGGLDDLGAAVVLLRRALSKSRQWVLTALRASGDLQTVNSSGTASPRPATRSSLAPSRPPSASWKRPGWPPGARKATAEPATGHRPPPIRMPTATVTVNRAMVGKRAWHDPPGNVLDRGLAEPAHGTSHVALVRLVVTDLRTAPRKERPHERSASPREPGGLSAMLSEWST